MSPEHQDDCWSVCLVMCSSQKAVADSNAADLYRSPRFQRDRAYAESNFDKWYILSGKARSFGANALVEPYDLNLARLSELSRDKWGERVARALCNELQGRDTRLEIRAVAAYRDPLLPWLTAFGFREDGDPVAATDAAESNVLRLVRCGRKEVRLV